MEPINNNLPDDIPVPVKAAMHAFARSHWQPPGALVPDVPVADTPVEPPANRSIPADEPPDAVVAMAMAAFALSHPAPRGRSKNIHRNNRVD